MHRHIFFQTERLYYSEKSALFLHVYIVAHFSAVGFLFFLISKKSIKSVGSENVRRLWQFFRL